MNTRPRPPPLFASHANPPFPIAAKTCAGQQCPLWSSFTKQNRARFLSRGFVSLCEAGLLRSARERVRGNAKRSVLGWTGSDRLSRGLSRSTMGAGGFNGRVRNGIGWNSPARTTSPAKDALFLFGEHALACFANAQRHQF